MAISLEYRFTFINVLEEMDYERSAVLSRRSSSLPPSRTRTESCDALECDEKDGQYVQTLTEKLPSIFGAQVQVAEEEILSSTMKAQDSEADAADAAIQSWSTAEVTDVTEVSDLVSESNEESIDPGSPGSNFSSASNPGSVGHPELCRRPCIYFAAGQCRNSADCNFCHLSHAHRSATLDKNQRKMIKELSKHEFLSLLLRCLRNKAAQGQFEEEADEVLTLFEERLSQEVEMESKVGAKVNNLERALARMTFFSVASLTTRAQFDKVFLERCKLAVGDRPVYVARIPPASMVTAYREAGRVHMHNSQGPGGAGDALLPNRYAASSIAPGTLQEAEPVLLLLRCVCRLWDAPAVAVAVWSLAALSSFMVLIQHQRLAEAEFSSGRPVPQRALRATSLTTTSEAIARPLVQDVSSTEADQAIKLALVAQIKIADNILQHPDEMRYRRIWKQNPIFREAMVQSGHEQEMRKLFFEEQGGEAWVFIESAEHLATLKVQIAELRQSLRMLQAEKNEKPWCVAICCKASFSMTSKLNHLLTARRSNCQSTMKKPSTLKAMDTARCNDTVAQCNRQLEDYERETLGLLLSRLAHEASAGKSALVPE
ncbi:unnamed protein product [Cladocopium goreaui]|uniref:Retrovirus-related Pol polyprotein from transposon TNT 1-94 n=1 Tax=Cladocopium goreaui TaxID=2562237 RepID=A0A9P1BFA6_9DINO|nr:unnamed protein product [Cladocopium goreaui]